MTVDLELPSAPESVGVARDALSRFEPHLAPERRADARLLVSEVVTNAVRHSPADAGDSIRVHIVARDETLRVEVIDHGRGFTPPPRPVESARPGGWGLYLVEKIAARWGVEGGGRTVVWFELAAR